VLQQAVQYAAARPDQPGNWTLIGANTIPINEYRVADLDVATGAGTGAFWVRFGIAIRQSGNGSSNVTTVPTWHQVDTSCRGKLATVRTLSLQPMGGNRFVPITGWMPGIGITGLSYAFVVTSYVTDLSYNLAWRVRNDVTENDAAGTVGATTPWDTIGAAITPGSLNTTHTNLVSFSTIYQEVQFGVRFTGTQGNADISVALCVLDD
jgi:hypothetical protein